MFDAHILLWKQQVWSPPEGTWCGGCASLFLMYVGARVHRYFVFILGHLAGWSRELSSHLPTEGRAGAGAKCRARWWRALSLVVIVRKPPGGWLLMETEVTRQPVGGLQVVHCLPSGLCTEPWTWGLKAVVWPDFIWGERWGASVWISYGDGVLWCVWGVTAVHLVLGAQLLVAISILPVALSRVILTISDALLTFPGTPRVVLFCSGQ